MQCGIWRPFWPPDYQMSPRTAKAPDRGSRERGPADTPNEPTLTRTAQYSMPFLALMPWS